MFCVRTSSKKQTLVIVVMFKRLITFFMVYIYIYMSVYMVEKENAALHFEHN